MGPYLQTEAGKRQKCQIDLLIQTKYNQLYVCEIQFSRTPLDKKVVHDVKEKIDRLEKPRGFSCRPVLMHVNGVCDAVLDADFFSAIIDFGQFLEPG